MLRLPLASGSPNPEIAAALFLSEKTVARHLSNIFTKLDVCRPAPRPPRTPSTTGSPEAAGPSRVAPEQRH